MATPNVFSIIPNDVGVWIVSGLNRQDAHSFNQVCKHTHALMKYVAALPQEYVTIENTYDWTKGGGTISTFMYLKLTGEILSEHPTFFGNVQSMKQFTKKMKEVEKKHLAAIGEPYSCKPYAELDSPALSSVKFIDRYKFDLPSFSSDLMKYDNKAFLPLCVLIDLPTKELGVNDLEVAANLAIHMNSPILLHAILFGHEQSINLPGNETSKTSNIFSYTESIDTTDGKHKQTATIHSTPIQNSSGLGYSLECALNNCERSDEKKLKLFKIIASHPAAKDISVYHIQRLMHYAVLGGSCKNGKWCGGNPAILKAIFSLHNAPQIPPNGKNSLASALTDAKEIGNQEMIDILLQHPKAPQIAGCTLV